MKKVIIKYWYTLPILLALLMSSLLLLFTDAPSILETIVGSLLLFTLIVLPVSWVILLMNKQWWKFFFSFVGTIIVLCVLSLPLMIVAMSSPDGFGKDHPIPEGLEYYLPLSADSCSTVSVDSLDADTYLNIWNDCQGGIYKYDLYYSSLPAGEIYLRCFEVTKNIPLSEDRLSESSRVVIDSTASFSKVVNQQVFTIYEGDWEDYYAARVEVWYKNAATKEDKKLLEKVYRVEGWMR